MVVEFLLQAAGWLDRQWAASVLPVLICLAAYLLLSGLDDLAMDVLWLFSGRRTAPPAPAGGGPEKRIAILLPLWKEADVIERMLDHNVASIRYRNYEILAGIYANDASTRAAVERAAARHPQVHVAVVPHDGPTSKADCLNWIYQRLIERELHGAPAAEIVLIHDAEDLIDPDSLSLVSRLTGEAGMVQVPVLALATPLHDLTHGVYCDDFAESQTKDLVTRARLGGFLPGCGVGTAFRREELEKLAEAESNRLFDPAALTEDYAVGLRLHELGCSQMFVPVQWRNGEPVATREYFPRNFTAAVRQRTRWVTGNCLQTWQRYGWGSRMRRQWLQAWFFWRDRKILWGSWVGLLSNLLFLWALAGWSVSKAASEKWWLGEAVAGHAWLNLLLAANLALCCERLAVRMYCSARIYGWAFAAGAPVRMIWGNLINAAASLRAVWQFARARWTGEPLRWLKTEHCYPSLESLRSGGAQVSAHAAAAAGAFPGPRLADSGRGADVWPAAAAPSTWQAGAVGAGAADAGCAAQVDRRVLRALPAQICDDLQIMPVGIEDGCIEIAAAAEPDPGIARLISSRAGMPVRFVGVPRERLAQLRNYRDGPPRHWRPSSQAQGKRAPFPNFAQKSGDWEQPDP